LHQVHAIDNGFAQRDVSKRTITDQGITGIEKQKVFCALPLLSYVCCATAEPAGSSLASATRLSRTPVVVCVKDGQLNRSRERCLGRCCSAGRPRCVSLSWSLGGWGWRWHGCRQGTNARAGTTTTSQEDSSQQP
jgi:hypothetical protein